MAVSSVYEQNKGILLSKYYSLQFKYIVDSGKVTDAHSLIEAINDIDLYKDDDILFLADKDFNYIYTSGNISEFFKEYAKEYALDNNNQVYDYYGTYGQGVIFPMTINNTTIYIGAHYLIYSSEMFGYMLLYIIAIFIISMIILVYFSKELCKDINHIENSLQSIYKDKKLNQNLYVTSNDELGELIIAINKIQELNNQQVAQIQSNQNMLMEKERLASLGQLIGGISHNLKTPIMSISGAAEGLSDLIKEYESSVGDSEVTVDDHHAIASDMKDWIEKIHSYTAYMSDIITAVKGQAVALSENENDEFTVDELFKRVNILMKHEIRNASLSLTTKIDLPASTKLTGDVNSLVQVVNNLIANAIQSYNGKKEDSVDLEAKIENKNVIISVTDHGSGMPQDVQDKLFKSMITTKGKNGTGLGMFMSYSTIKGHFNGEMKFTTELGKGTTFYILIPLPNTNK